jgi:hypothetical protein
MTIDFGNVDAGITLYIPFHTFDSNGGSVTITGLAVTDIEIYKNGAATTRASDNGYAMLDTDGIDFASKTGIHGFSIDLSDNSDAGFYAAGSFYWVVISAITVDTQTVNFVAATFRIGPAAANVTQWLGTAAATPTVAGVPEVDVTHLNGVAQSLQDLKDFADEGYDPSTNKVQGVVLTDTVTTYTGDTPQTGDAYAVVNSGTHGNAALKTLIDAILEDTGTTLDDLVDNLEARLGTPSDLGSGATIAANLVDIEAQTDDIGVAGAGLTALATQASVNDLPTNAELTTALGTADDAVLAQVALVKTETDKIASIKTKTDSLTYTVAGQVDANVQSINDALLEGDGSSTPWGPA